MPAGKLTAQAGHAFLDSFFAAAAADPARAAAYRLAAPGTKVVLAAPDLSALEEAAALAAALSLPHALITDSGHILPPHFNGGPVVTALGLGPATREEVRPLLRRFRLL